MNPRKVAALIRRAGETWVLLQSDGTEAARFSGILPIGKLTLSVPADVVLSAGDILAMVRKPDVLYLVTNTASNRFYSDVTVVKVNCLADVSRFTDGPRDTFGRVTESTPTVIATSVPLYFDTATTSRDQRSPDRSTTETGYTFTTSSVFDIRPKDRLSVCNLSLIVTTLLLSVEGVTEFKAESMA